MTKIMLFMSVALSWQLVFSGTNMSTPKSPDIILRFGNTLEDILKNWKLKPLVGKDEYGVIRRENGNILHILSNQSASILFKKVDFSVYEYPIIRWQWQVNEFPKYAESSSEYTIDDYAARICVAFPAWTIRSTKFLVYVWDDRTDEIGVVKPSSFSDNCKIIVVEGGKQNQGQWVTEERNIIEDYIRVFGSEPKKAAAGIGVMSDSDDTKSSTDAYYHNIYLKSEI
ncbi:MAG: DUF3047 domain-containing protein [Candidatus Auribacter fodinae]|jgi:hypothetical protein|uniref:DUF3047 domain-containing protein n=1 Tax=Candidatus Auribacter fodinae TaxID=2093366 RepID=A0A3A4R385_9BACT|nr:MAG: DUF3047 domain-containing protein [Candidatus Auribacter fodinae]